MSKLAYFARETLISLRRNLMMTIAGILTIGVSMSLLGGSLLLSKLVDNGVAGIREGLEFDVYLNLDVTPSQLDAVTAQMDQAKADHIVSDYEFLDEAAAFEDAQKLFAKNPEAIAGMGPGEFPQSFRTKLADASFAAEAADLFEGRPGVKTVLSPEKVAENIQRVTSWIRLAFLVMVIVLGAAALFLVVNTIRLATYARRREIEVMKLVGASNWFVQVPFMAEGVAQGAVGAGVAVGVVYFLKGVLQRSLGNLETGVIKTFYVTGADAFRASAAVFALGILIGLIGSLLGLRRFLDV
jgi:cell division transport system permease protein